ncbi:MAG: hypothetical protein C0606_10670 [Hyphomicrobiales bacterium]|nr:MAG: hypothetical protein C0606_10670 [Hyphomicrobiales bacterium]
MQQEWISPGSVRREASKGAAFGGCISSARAFLRDEEGTTAIEYSLLAAMFAIISIGAASAVSEAVSENLFALVAAMFPAGQ